jgi:ferredoxin
MKIDAEKCVGCGKCASYCTMRGSIMSFGRNPKNPAKIYAVIDEKECVECCVCLRSGVCQQEALYQPELSWPRIVRKNFSDPLKIHPETRIPGRGTEEMKTNEVTGRFKRGFYGVALEMGRPGVGAWFRDVEKAAMALASLGVAFEENNPVTKLITDRKTGQINPEVLEEKVLSAIIEFLIPQEKLPTLLEALKKIAEKIDTVFSGDIISRVEKDGSISYLKVFQEGSRFLSINGKSNVGLGRPKYRED